MLKEGSVFGRYRILSMLGKGGMGHVYRARDTLLHRDIAIKILHHRASKEGPSAADSAAMLLREARAAAALSHPNAVSVFDVGEVNGTGYIAMELILGKPLRAYVGDVTVTAERKVRWLVSVADALDAAHKAGMVHRDIKPENILVAEDDAIKVLDFGIAKRLSRPEAASSDETEGPASYRTEDGRIRGTPGYMSPEFVHHGTFDARSDQYAWGVVAYELFAGVQPMRSFGSDGLPELLSARVPGLPAGVAVTVMRALLTRPDLRFASMSEVATALREVTGIERTGSALASSVAPELGPVATTAATVTVNPLPALTGGETRVAPLGGRSARTGTLIAAGAAVILGAVALQHNRTAASPPVTVDAAAGKPITVLDLPVPRSRNPEAMAAYREGVVASHDGLEGAVQAYERATTLDPGYTAAYIPIFLTLVAGWDHATTIEAYGHALAGRDQLSPRDRGLVDAYEPLLIRQPADWALCEERVRALVNANPMDEDLATTLASLLVVEGKTAEAGDVLTKALELDPADASAWGLRTDLAIRDGDFEAARRSARACLEKSPRATLCIGGLEDADSFDGRCADLDALANRRIATSPESFRGYRNLFDGELGRREPEGVLIATEQRMLVHLTPEMREVPELHYPWVRAVARGDFAAAGLLLDKLDALAVRHADVDDQLKALFERAELATETGDERRAVAAATAYLEKSGALPPATVFSYEDIGQDATTRLVGLLRRAGKLSPEVARQRRDAWFHEWDARVEGRVGPVLWAQAYAAPAESREEALEALARAPADLKRLGAGRNLESESIGRVLSLAGKTDEAIPFLANASKRCDVRRFPFVIPRASYWLGLAQEAKGARAEACAAYQAVVARWGNATPRSVTASLATEHMRALACAK